MSYSHKLHLVLEGNDDCQLLLSVISNDSAVNTVCVYGADRVIETVNTVESDKKLQNNLKVLGIIDRDYREPLKSLPSSANILISDHRDIECMMVDSPVFAKVLRELGSAEKVKSLGGAAAVRAKIVCASRLIGELRYYSQFSSEHWSFKQLELSKLIDKKTLEIDTKKLVQHLGSLQPAGKAPISMATLSAAQQACKGAKCQKQKNYFSNDYLLCRGHDLMYIFGLALRSFCGSQKAIDSTAERIETLFRVGYGPYFTRSDLFKNIDAWLGLNGLTNDVVLL